MSFYRSDDVSFYRLVIPRENAWDIMNKLGQQKLLHILPQDTAVLSRPFLSTVRRCEEALHHIRSLQKNLQEKNIYEKKDSFSDQAYHELFRLWDQQYAKSSGHPANVINDVIGQIQHAWSYHQDLVKRAEVLQSKLQSYRDNLALLKAGEQRFGRQFFTIRGVAEQMGRSLVVGSKISYKCGVIKLEEELRFKKTIFRITQGNSVVQCIPFSQVFGNLFQGEETRVAFFILYPGGVESYLDRKITKLVENFCEGEYELPQNDQQFNSIKQNLDSGCNQTQSLLKLTQQELNDFLCRLTERLDTSEYFRRHEYLKLYIMKQKDLYTTLNQMEMYSNFIQGKVYIRTCDVEKVQKEMNLLEEQLKHSVGQLVPQHTERLPTHFLTNDYTCSAQEIVETYGVAQYKQANPGFFTTITFPFLFGVMFGDIAHGLIVFSFALYMVFFIPKDTTNLLFKMLRPHRYMFTMMGFFAAYCGFIYNDFLSIDLDLFGSCFDLNGVQVGEEIPQTAGCVYPLGIDPVWAVADNNLVFLNSLKMKISVIIAVVHMTLGIFIKATNCIYFGKWIDFFFEFIPQLLFMTLLFGYMDFLIVFKWLKDWGYYSPVAPSIITTMINMPLKLGKTQDCCGGQPMWGVYGQTNQDQIQLIFLLVALLCIPWILVPKPLILIYCYGHGQHKVSQEDDSANPTQTGRLLSGQNLEGEEPIEFAKKKVDQQQSSSQIFVHQLIETIQFVLGCISNTASYLRLWALSLAHSQLSQVFFDKLVMGSLVKGFGGIPMMLFGFICLAGITFGVLLCMDMMQCFLHTLRLHWVEFNNKFYKGTGFAFVFYSFKKRMEEELTTEG